MKAYTLIELIISVMLLAMILLGGTAIFYQSLKSAGMSDVGSNLDSTLQSILRGVEKDIRFDQVIGVGNGSRPDCVTAGVVGYQGDTLSVTDLGGQGTIYKLSNGRIASVSAQSGQIYYLNNSQINVIQLQFTWYCQTNISDKIKIAIDASSSALGTGIGVERNVSTEINLLNSGLN